MQTRRIVTALLLSLATFYLYLFITFKLWPPQPPAATTQPADTASASAPASGPGATTQPAATSTVGAELLPAMGIRPVSGDSVETIILGDADEGSPFPMKVEITPRGAGVRDVRLRGYMDEVKRKGVEPKPYPIMSPVTGREDADDGFSFVTEQVAIDYSDGKEPRVVKLDKTLWTLVRSDKSSATLQTTLVDSAGNSVLLIDKTYTLPEQTVEAMTSDLDIKLTMQNLTGASIRVIVSQQGPTGFHREDFRQEDRAVLYTEWTTDGMEAESLYRRSDVIKKNGVQLGKDAQEARVGWAAVVNRYFTCVMAPVRQPGIGVIELFADLSAVTRTDIPDDSEDQAYQDLTFRYVTYPLTLDAKGSVDLPFTCYIGPKKKKAFTTIESYSSRNYLNIVSSDFYFCAPAPLVYLMSALLGFFEAIVQNYGLAIIVLVLVVRTILHPVTKKSQTNMFKMQKEMGKLQPKLAVIKEKYANDRAKMNQAMMEVYQEEGINPAAGMLSCLPMALQMPIWAALWVTLNYMIEMRHQPFDGWWIKDLSSPDALVMFSQPIHIPLLGFLLGGPVTSFNLLPIFLCITQLIQAKFMPRSTPPAGATGAAADRAADQLETQRRMMMFMSVFFMFIFYNMPAGLNLYIMSSNIFGIVEQYRIRKHLAEMDEQKALEQKKAGGKTPPDKKPKDKPQAAKATPAEPKKQSWLQKKWAELEKQAEQARKAQHGGGKNKPRR